MTCSNCGSSTVAGSAFCVRCGNALPQTPPQPVYAQPAPIAQNVAYKDQTVTMGEWFVFFLLLCIPIVNVIMFFVWAFSPNTKPSKANLCRLQLLLIAIGVGLTLIIGLIMAATIGSFLGL